MADDYRDVVCVHVCSAAHSCLTLCDPMFYRLSGSSVHGIFQARILKWVAMPSSKGSNLCLLCLLHWQTDS